MSGIGRKDAGYDEESTGDEYDQGKTTEIGDFDAKTSSRCRFPCMEGRPRPKAAAAPRHKAWEAAACEPATFYHQLHKIVQNSFPNGTWPL